MAMATMKITGSKRIKKAMVNLSRKSRGELDRTLRKQADDLVFRAKTKRFRRVPSPLKRKKGPRGGDAELLYPPVPGILTMRHPGGYAQRIRNFKISTLHYKIVAGVDYAIYHENSRPVLKAVYLARRQFISIAIQRKVKQLIRSEGLTV